MRRATDKQIRKWLDDQVKSWNLGKRELNMGLGEYNKLCNYNFSSRDGIQIGGEATREIAKRLDFILNVMPYVYEDIEYQVYFHYNDVKFFGIEIGAEYKERGEIL